MVPDRWPELNKYQALLTGAVPLVVGPTSTLTAFLSLVLSSEPDQLPVHPACAVLAKFVPEVKLPISGFLVNVDLGLCGDNGQQELIWPHFSPRNWPRSPPWLIQEPCSPARSRGAPIVC